MINLTGVKVSGRLLHWDDHFSFSCFGVELSSISSVTLWEFVDVFHTTFAHQMLVNKRDSFHWKMENYFTQRYQQCGTSWKSRIVKQIVCFHSERCSSIQFTFLPDFQLNTGIFWIYAFTFKCIILILLISWCLHELKFASSNPLIVLQVQMNPVSRNCPLNLAIYLLWVQCRTPGFL